MFGKRLIPCTLIGIAVSFLLFAIGTLTLAVVPAVGLNFPTVGFAMGITSCAGIGLYADMVESETSHISATAASTTLPPGFSSLFAPLTSMFDKLIELEKVKAAAKTPPT